MGLKFLSICLCLLSAVVSTSSNLLPLRRRAGSNPASLTATARSNFGHFFNVEVTFGDQTFILLADTGSSDTWVVSRGYQCFNRTDGSELPQASCRFRNVTYSPSSTFSPIANETLGALYGAGIALGTLGREDVTLAGLTVHQQVIGLVNKVTLQEDDLQSGILGLGYPVLTSAHPGNTPPPANASLLLNKLPYDPLLTSMHKQGTIPGWFSLSLERLPRNATSGPGGYLGLGVLPPVAHESTFARAQVEVTDALPALLTNGTREITEWTLSVQGVAWDRASGSYANVTGGSNTTRFQAVVDSGNYYNQLPAEVAAPVHAAYSPPAVYDAVSGLAPVDCNAIPPSFSLTIAGQVFHHQPEDLILQLPDGSCTATILPPPPGQLGISLNFLGDAFMHNVVSVFDFEKNEMRFAARTNTSGAGSGSGPKSPSSGRLLRPEGVVMSLALFAVLGMVM